LTALKSVNLNRQSELFWLKWLIVLSC